MSWPELVLGPPWWEVHVLHEHILTALGYRPNLQSISKASASCQDIRPLQVRVFTIKQERSRRGHHYMKRLDQGHLHPKLESRPGIEPGPPGWDASTLEKSHANILLIAIRNLHI